MLRVLCFQLFLVDDCGGAVVRPLTVIYAVVVGTRLGVLLQVQRSAFVSSVSSSVSVASDSSTRKPLAASVHPGRLFRGDRWLSHLRGPGVVALHRPQLDLTQSANGFGCSV